MGNKHSDGRPRSPRSGDLTLMGIIAVVMLVVDQVVKIWVKTHMALYSSTRVTSWFFILFTENNGMAFGMELFGKLFLSLFRIAAVSVLVWFIVRLAGKRYPKGFLIALALVTAGAAGNIFDCVFYGLIFSPSTPLQAAHLVPWGSGYSSLFHGKVVDMLYFPLVEWDWPQWMPWVAGRHFIFFSPIFNVADSCITVGLLMILFFYSGSLSRSLQGSNAQPGKEKETKKKKR